MSANKNKSKLLKRRKFRIYRKLIIWVLFIGSIVYGSIFWFNHDFFRISDVEITGNKFVETQTIRDIYKEKTSQNFLFFISKENFLFIPKRDIAGEIKSLLPVESVSIKKTSLNSLRIEISEYKPIATYCHQQDCYLVNKEGRLFLATPDFYVEDLIVLEGSVIDNPDANPDVDATADSTADSDSNTDSESASVSSASVSDSDTNSTTESNSEDASVEIIGLEYTNADIFKKLIETTRLLSKEDIEIAKIRSEDFETYHLETIAGTDILIEKADDPEEVVANLKAALVQESIHEIQFDNIDYFDLRFEDKVFYKLK